MSISQNIPKVEVLFSTLNDGINEIDLSFVNEDFNALIVHQVTNTQSGYNYDSYLSPHVRVIVSNDKGLSKSRNLAIKYAQGEISIIADDDIRHSELGLKKIYNIFKENEVAICIFMLHNPNGELFRDYSRLNAGILRNTRFSACSSELAVRTELLKNSTFDEAFGLGSHYPGFEETILLDEWKKSSHKFYFLNEPIAMHDDFEHTGSRKGKMYFFAYGAFLARTNKNLLLELFRVCFGEILRNKSTNGFWTIFSSVLSGYFSYKRG